MGEMQQQDISILQDIIDDNLTRHFLPELSQVSAQRLFGFFTFYRDIDEGLLWALRNIDKKLVGFIAIMDISTHPTLFYAMHPDFRGQGIMKEAVQEISRYVSTRLFGILYSEVMPMNVVSQHILLSTGFRLNKTASSASKLIYEFDLQ